MPVLFQFPRSTRSSKARPLHSALRKSGAKSIRRRMKTVHFASTKTLLSAPRTPPTLPLIPYDTHSHSPQSAHYSHGLHTPNASYDSGTTAASSGSPYTPGSSSSPYHRTGATPNSQHLSPDLVAYYQPSSSTLKPLPTSTAPKVVHAETVPLEVEWDCDWEPEKGRVVKKGRQKIPREKLPKTPHPKKAIDLEMPGLSPSVGSYFPAGAGVGYTASEAGHDGERGRGRGRERMDRLRGRSRSHSQQPQGHVSAPPPQLQSQSHAHAQHGVGGGSGFLQVPQRQRRGSHSSSGSGPQMQMQMSSSAPTASYMNAHMRPPPNSSPHALLHGHGPGQLQMNYGYPAPSNVTSSPSGHTRSRTSSLNIFPHPQQSQQLPQQPSPLHQQTHHRHHSASSYPAPPPNVRRRSHSNPPEIQRTAYAPGASPTASHMQSHGGAHTPQIHSASPYLSVPTRENTSGRKRAGSFSYGAPPPSPHTSLNGSKRPAVTSGAHSSGLKVPPPPMLRRRTASNPHLPSSGRHQHQPRHRTTTPHRYLAVPTPSSHSSRQTHPEISWDMRLPPATATRTRAARGAADAKVHYLSPQALVEPATSPPCAFMRVSATRVHGGGKREGWPWPIAIYPAHEGSSQAITLNDVLHALHAALRARASEKEYERLLPDRLDKRAVSTAYEGRWREESRVELAASKGHSHNGANDKKAGVGLRRVDFLRGKTVFVGLEPIGGVEGEWCLVVR